MKYNNFRRQSQSGSCPFLLESEWKGLLVKYSEKQKSSMCFNPAEFPDSFFENADEDIDEKVNMSTSNLKDLVFDRFESNLKELFFKHEEARILNYKSQQKLRRSLVLEMRRILNYITKIDLVRYLYVIIGVFDDEEVQQLIEIELNSRFKELLICSKKSVNSDCVFIRKELRREWNRLVKLVEKRILIHYASSILLEM